MFLLWKIRCFHRVEKRFIDDNDNLLYLDTTTLEPTTKAAIELLVESETHRRGRGILKYRNLFVEGTPGLLNERVMSSGFVTGVGPMDYHEDEEGNEITVDEIGRILTDDPNAILIPPGAQQHDIDYMLSEPDPVPVEEIAITDEQVNLLGYFSRDYAELCQSEFMKNGAGSITGQGSFGSFDGAPVLETAVTDDEIRSFVSIFRRLYMAREPANFLMATQAFVESIGDHALAKWVAANGDSYEQELNAVVDCRPFVQPGEITFTRKLLIEVFMYTQYAHQPDDRRQRQYGECLAEVGDRRDLLTWMFLNEVWKTGLLIQCSGKQIVQWFNQYCQHHGLSPDVLPSVAAVTPGLGAKEKEVDRQARLYHEKAEDLATDIWKQNGRPDGGAMQFLHQAKTRLDEALGRTSV